MLERATRLAPATGLVFTVLVLLGGPVFEQSAPSASASPAVVVAFYDAHRDRERVGVYLLAFAFIAFVYFAGALRTRWRERPGCEGLTTLLVVAAGVELVGQGLSAGSVYGLTADPSRLDPSTAHALNLVGNGLVVVSASGMLLFGLTAGLMILRGPGVVPRWLGWLAIVIGVLFVLGPIEFIGFLLLVVWVVAMSVLLLRSGGSAATADVPHATSTAAASA